MKADKKRWKELPYYERLIKRLRQKGVSEDMLSHIEERYVAKKQEFEK